MTEFTSYYGNCRDFCFWREDEVAASLLPLVPITAGRDALRLRRPAQCQRPISPLVPQPHSPPALADDPRRRRQSQQRAVSPETSRSVRAKSGTRVSSAAAQRQRQRLARDLQEGSTTMTTTMTMTMTMTMTLPNVLQLQLLVPLHGPRRRAASASAPYGPYRQKHPSTGAAHTRAEAEAVCVRGGGGGGGGGGVGEGRRRRRRRCG